MLGEKSCRLQYTGHARRVVVGTRSVGFAVDPLEARESMSPDMITYRSGWRVPRCIATTFTTLTSLGMRPPAGTRAPS